VKLRIFFDSYAKSNVSGINGRELDLYGCRKRRVGNTVADAKMNSRQRLIKTLNGEGTDRVPISLYEFDGFYDDWIFDHPEYVEILEYAEGKTDKMYFWTPSDGKPVLFYGVIEEESLQRTTWKEEESTYTKTVIKTPKGTVCSVSRQDSGVHTSWTIQRLCKNVEDAKKILSIPYEPWQPRVDSFSKLDERLSGSGIVLGDVPDALCLTVELFGLTKFLKMYMMHRNLILELMDFFHERILNYLRHLLTEGAVTLYRIVGPEYATPPYLHPREFDRLVTSYDVDLVDLLHRHGGYARLHSHGRVKRALSSLKEMGVDAVDPLEPPPDGDIELSEARRILGSEVTLIGNIEERLFEVGSKRDIERAVKKAIEEGSIDGSFVLCPTAMPLTTPLSRRAQENIIVYIDCGLKYGKS